MKINHNRIRLRALAIGGYLLRCAIRQYACSTDYVEKVVKFLYFGVIRTRFFYFNFFLFYPPPKKKRGSMLPLLRVLDLRVLLS